MTAPTVMLPAVRMSARRRRGESVSQHALVGESLQVGAGLTKSTPDAFEVADPEVPSDKAVQVDAAGDDVASSLHVPESVAVGQGEFVEHLGLDQRQVAATNVSCASSLGRVNTRERATMQRRAAECAARLRLPQRQPAPAPALQPATAARLLHLSHNQHPTQRSLEGLLGRQTSRGQGGTLRWHWHSPDDASTCFGPCSATTVHTKNNLPHTRSPLDKPD